MSLLTLISCSELCMGVPGASLSVYLCVAGILDLAVGGV